MKTKDLIKELQKKNQDAEVYINGHELEYIFERVSKNKDENFVDITSDDKFEDLIYGNKR